MFPKFIKIVLAILTLGYAVYQFTEEFIGNGIALIFLSGMFVFLYYKMVKQNQKSRKRIDDKASWLL